MCSCVLAFFPWSGGCPLAVAACRLHNLESRIGKQTCIHSAKSVVKIFKSFFHALSIEPGHVRWEPKGVCLVPRADFIAIKNHSPAAQLVEIFLPSISSFSSVEEDIVWCPVRALKWYVDRARSKRISSSLFVSSIEPFR